MALGGIPASIARRVRSLTPKARKSFRGKHRAAANAKRRYSTAQQASSAAAGARTQGTVRAPVAAFWGLRSHLRSERRSGTRPILIRRPASYCGTSLQLDARISAQGDWSFQPSGGTRNRPQPTTPFHRAWPSTASLPRGHRFVVTKPGSIRSIQIQYAHDARPLRVVAAAALVRIHPPPPDHCRFRSTSSRRRPRATSTYHPGIPKTAALVTSLLLPPPSRRSCLNHRPSQ